MRKVFNSVTKQFKGFAYVEFKNPESVKKSLLLNGKSVKGREIQVDFDTGKVKGSYKLNLEE